MDDVFEEWFKRIELRLKYELSNDYYEKVMSIMLTELKMLYSEEKTKQEKKLDKQQQNF